MPKTSPSGPASFLGSYLCDPNANIACPKTDCVLLGGKCFSTKDKLCALPEHSGIAEMLTPERLMQMQMLVRQSRQPEYHLYGPGGGGGRE